LFLLRLLLTIVVRHGDDSEDEVDEVERAEKDDDNEKEYVIQSVGTNDLTNTRVFSYINLLKGRCVNLSHLAIEV